MSDKPFFSILLILFFSFLTACGGSDSKSSGDNPQKKTENKTEEKTKACVAGDNPLKQGESCIHKNIKYTCNSGKVSGGGFSARGNFIINGVKIYCE